jgi:hypothetical protein
VKGSPEVLAKLLGEADAKAVLPSVVFDIQPRAIDRYDAKRQA